MERRFAGQRLCGRANPVLQRVQMIVYFLQVRQAFA
jgi:hypothetical protein